MKNNNQQTTPELIDNDLRNLNDYLRGASLISNEEAKECLKSFVERTKNKIESINDGEFYNQLSIAHNKLTNNNCSVFHEGSYSGEAEDMARKLLNDLGIIEFPQFMFKVIDSFRIVYMKGWRYE